VSVSLIGVTPLCLQALVIMPRGSGGAVKVFVVGWGETADAGVPTAGLYQASLTRPEPTSAFFKCEQSRDRNDAVCAGWTELADCVRMALLHYAVDEKSPLGVDHAATQRV
jgi:hypothetical protein